MAAVAKEDERTVRQMQDAEMGQALDATSTSTCTDVPPVSERPVSVEATPDIPADELVVLSLRYSVMCFGLLDIVIQVVFFAITLYVIERELLGPEFFRGVPLWTLWLIMTTLLIGPVCGIIGARRLQRGLVLVYIVFCVVNMFCRLLGAFTNGQHPVFVLQMFQVWLMWIVCKLWSALGIIPTCRNAQMRDPDYLGKAPVRIVYW